MCSDAAQNTTMSREEFVTELARRVNMTEERTNEVLDIMLELLAECATGQCPPSFLETVPFEIVMDDDDD